MKEDEADPGARPAAVWNHWLSSVGERVAPAPISGPVAPKAPPAEEDEPPADEDATLVQSSVLDWQRLWLATQRRPWGSLAVIPAGRRGATPRVARALVGVGSCHLGSRIRLLDATTIRLSDLGACLRGLTDPRPRPTRVILALGSVLENPPGLAVAQAADAAILCVALGESTLAEAERTIEEVGRARFVGSLILR
jgi:hypothetical protein